MSNNIVPAPRVKQYSEYIVIVIFTFFPLLLISCSKDHIDHIKDENKFAYVYVDLLIVQEKTGTDTLKYSSEKQKIFRKYNITGKQFEATTDYYNKNPELWKTFFEKADLYLASIRKDKLSITPAQPAKKNNLQSRRSF